MIFPIFFSSECGHKAEFHECLIRQHTSLFSRVFANEEDDKSSRDIFGNYVFILMGVDLETVRGLRDLLYTGK